MEDGKEFSLSRSGYSERALGVACGGRVWVPGPRDEKRDSVSMGGRRGVRYLTFLKSQFPHLKSEVDSVTGLL